MKTSQWIFALFLSVVIHAGIIFFSFSQKETTTTENIPSANESQGEISQNDETLETVEPAETISKNEIVGEKKENPSSENISQTKKNAKKETEKTETPAFYLVKAGDTLTKIAKQYNTTPEELARINGKTVKKLNYLWVGQKIKLK